MFLLRLTLDQGYATGPGVRLDPIPIILLNNVIRVAATEGAMTVVFSSSDAAKQAHETTGWPFASETSLEIQTAGNHITALPPQFTDCTTAFYARWFVHPDRSPPFRH